MGSEWRSVEDTLFNSGVCYTETPILLYVKGQVQSALYQTSGAEGNEHR